MTKADTNHDTERGFGTNMDASPARFSNFRRTRSIVYKDDSQDIQVLERRQTSLTQIDHNDLLEDEANKNGPSLLMNGKTYYKEIVFPKDEEHLPLQKKMSKTALQLEQIW